MADDTTLITPTEMVELSPQGGLEKEGMSAPQKVGVAVGLTSATGLAAYGLYRLGDYMGWWRRTPTIVIDDEPAPKGGGGGGGGGTKPSAPSTKPRGRAIGRPPNITGDSAGYNTTLWPGPGPVRLAMLAQGYKMSATDDPIADEGKGHPQVRRLQGDWNKVIRGIDKGKVKLPKTVDQPSLLKHFRGVLVVDGLPGKNTLNGLEVLFTNYVKNAVFWKQLVEQAQ